MNWRRIHLDGIAMSAVFNLAVGLFWLVWPSSFTGMYPKQIQKLALPMDAKDRKHVVTMYLTVYPPVILYGVISAYCVGIESFWPCSGRHT